MARLALEIQNNAPRDPLVPVGWAIPSSFTTALDTVSTCVFLVDTDDERHFLANIT